MFGGGTSRSRRAIILLVLVSVAAGLVGVWTASATTAAQSVQGETLVVNEDGDAEYETIQAAIDDASNGDTIRVRAGEYDGFRVGKDVQIVTTGAAVKSDIQIVGDAAPTIRGITIRNGTVDAVGTSGDWTLQDMTIRNGTVEAARTDGDWELRGMTATGTFERLDATRSTGKWLITNSHLWGIKADEATGDWRVDNSTIIKIVNGDGTSGDWRVVNTTVGAQGPPVAEIVSPQVRAVGSSGDWTIIDSRILSLEYSIDAAPSSGAWQVVDSKLIGTISAQTSTGPVGIFNSYILPGPNPIFDDISPRSTVGGHPKEFERGASPWTVKNSTLPGSVSMSTQKTSDFTNNYWGQPGGPRPGQTRFDQQCDGTLDCSNPLDTSPVNPPTIPDWIKQYLEDSEPPVAVLSVDSLRINGTAIAAPGESLTFDGSASADPDGEIQSYEWSVNGDAAGTGPRFIRSFEESGEYRVTLTVSDGTTTDSTQLTVFVGGETTNDRRSVPNNLPPVATLRGPAETVTTGEAVTLSAAGSDDLDGPSLSEYRWDTDGDGSPERTTTEPQIEVTYDEPNSYEPRVTVVDPAGATDTAATTVTVAEPTQLPEATFEVRSNEDGSVVAGPPVIFDAGDSVASEGRIVAYEWDFGDGTTRRVDRSAGPRARNSPSLRPTTAHEYTQPGEYTVTLTIVDSFGRRVQTSRTVRVEQSDAVRVGPVESTIPGPMIGGVGMNNDYAVVANSEDPIESVVFEFPNGETREATEVGRLPGEGRGAPANAWVLSDVDIDTLLTDGTNVVTVQATDESGRRGQVTFAVDVFDPPGWFEFAMGEDPTVTRNDQGEYVLQADEPTIPSGELIGPTFEFDVPLEELDGEYTVGVGASYGFEYVFADRLGTASGGGAISLTAPLDGLELEADVGSDLSGSRSRSFSVDLSGTVRVAEDGSRVDFERGRVAFGTEVSTTVPLGGVAIYIPPADATIGVANVLLTATERFEPAVGLEVNDARTALVPSEVELTEGIDLQVSAGAGTSVSAGPVRAGVEARGIAGTGATFTTELYPELDTERVTLGLRAGVRACLGPCATEWLLNDEYPLIPRDDEQSAQVAAVETPRASP